jgi:hypothetical protein
LKATRGHVHWQKLWPIIAALPVLLTACGTGRTVLEESTEQVYTVEPNTELSIHNHNGAVFVYGSDVNELRVQSTKKAYSRERLNQIAIEVTAKPGSVSVTAKFPTQRKWIFSDQSGTVDFTIVVPATASISALDLNAGEVLLDNMRGRESHARLGDGRILARNCFTNLDLTMNRGTLSLSYDWWEHESFSAQVNVAQGNAWVFLPAEAAFHLLAHSVHGKIANDFNNLPLSMNSAASGMRIDQIINGGGPAIIKIQVQKGDIKVAEANP